MEKEEKSYLDPSKFNGGYKLHDFNDLKQLYEVYITDKKDKDQIEKAYHFMLSKHVEQYRKSGEPYFHHLIEVAYILASLQAGPATIISGLLHDVVEDTNVTIEEIKKIWGSDVAKIVDSLTKIQRLKLSKIDSSDFEAEDHRKIFLGMAQDVRVIFVKLADRLHNMRTLYSLSEERQLALSRETLDVFVPIAHRLGVNFIKSELEDLCLLHLEPNKYHEIEKLLNKKNKVRKKSLDSLSKRIADILFENNIPFTITNRVKTIYSIYEKMYHKGKSFEEIYDVMALRVITTSELNCYEILGLIHQTYKPIPGRFKDYIAMPKPNMYQSLHTSIVSGDGNIYEVQIRTKEMDEIAEAGVAAHWAYKEGSYNPQKEQREIENRLHWFRDFVSMSSTESESAKEYMDSLTSDIFGANVYVFTPKGKVIEIPKDGTPLDFAYRIHTKVAESAIGAIVNNVLVSLNTKLKTGDVVEIKTSKNPPGPNEKWLDWVAGSHSKALIRKFLLKKNADLIKDEKIQKAKNSCMEQFKDRGINNELEVMRYLNDKALWNHFGHSSFSDFMLAISARTITPSQIVDFLGIEKKVSYIQNPKHVGDENDAPVYCKGVGKIAISLASCCTPIPGDDIIGFITKGKGITVHRKNCPNMVNEKIRLVSVYWKENLPDKDSYPVSIMIEANDRLNLLSDIMGVFSSLGISCTNLHARLNRQTYITFISATIYVNNINRLNKVFSSLNGLDSVLNTSRIIH